MSAKQPLLAHHFDSLEQQHEALTLGMWLFLATEVMFFGGLFLSYTVFRNMYPAGFAQASHHLNITLGSINTAVLIGSSLTMALAVHAAQTGERRRLCLCLILTMLLGLGFLGIKAVEYTADYYEKLIPGLNFDLREQTLHGGAEPQQVELFFWLYFTMTGLHALHMIIGLGVLGYLLYRGYQGRYFPENFWPVELAGLYWHFVDIIWIFLFPLLYLIGTHG